MLLTKPETLKEKNQQKHKQWHLDQKERKQQLHIRGKEKTSQQKMAENNSKLFLSGKFDFDPEEILDKSLLFNLKKTSEEKIFDLILEKILDKNNIY